MKTIGEILRSARLEKGYTLEELQKITKIQARYLEAVEEDRFEMLPGSYYARNFIRQYAQAVESDEEYLIGLFDGGAPKPSTDTASIGSRTTLNNRKTAPLSVNSLNWPMILLSLASLLIVGIVFWLTLRESTPPKHIQDNQEVAIEGSFSNEAEKKVTKEPENSSKIKETTTSSTKEAEKETKKEEEMLINVGDELGNVTPVTIQEAKTPLELSFTGVDGRCWIGVNVAGAAIFGETIEMGQTVKVSLPKGTTEATITLGDSRMVKVDAAGQKIDFNKSQTNLDLRNLNLTISYADVDNEA